MRPGPAHLRICPPPEGGEDALVRAAPPDRPLDFEGLYRRYGRYVAAVTFHVLGRDDDVDDVVQEVFLSAMKGLSSVRNEGALRGWLRTITVRVAGGRLRQRRLRAFLGLDRPPRYEDLVAPGASPEQRALLAGVYRLLDRLPVADRLAWTLRHVEDEPLDEVARLCSCSLATAKRRISAAHQAIEKQLGEPPRFKKMPRGDGHE